MRLGGLPLKSWSKANILSAVTSRAEGQRPVPVLILQTAQTTSASGECHSLVRLLQRTIRISQRSSSSPSRQSTPSQTYLIRQIKQPHLLPLPPRHPLLLLSDFLPHLLLSEETRRFVLLEASFRLCGGRGRCKSTFDTARGSSMAQNTDLIISLPSPRSSSYHGSLSEKMGVSAGVSNHHNRANMVRKIHIEPRYGSTESSQWHMVPVLRSAEG